MNKSISIIVAVVIFIISIPIGTALASVVTDAIFSGTIRATNNSTAATNVSGNVSINTAAWIAAGTLNSTATNAAIWNSTGGDTEFMFGWGDNPCIVYFDTVPGTGSIDYTLYTNATGGDIVYFPADAGATVADDASMEPGGNFTSSVTGRIDTDSGTAKNIISKATLLVRVSNNQTGNIEALIAELTTWTLRSTPVENDWRGIGYSSNLTQFAAVSNNGTGDRIMTSEDGITWTSRVNPAAVNYQGVTWSPDLGLWVAVANNGALADQVATSPDGIAWTKRTSAVGSAWKSVAWSPELNLYAAVAESGVVADQVMTSPDGITWTKRTSGADADWQDVVWCPSISLYIAVANGGAGNKVITSPDGITWTGRVATANNQWKSVDWSEELTLAVAVSEDDTGAGDRVMSSPDGINWTARDASVGNSWQGVSWSPELSLFVAVSDTGAGDRVMSSPDGITWTTGVSAADLNWNDIAWSPELLVFAACSSTGSPTGIMTNASPSAMASGVTSGEHILTVSANTTHLDITVDSVLEDSVILNGATIPDTSTDWTFFENGVMPYVESANLTVGGNLVFSFEGWEYAETFTDASGEGNTLTPSFRTTSSDADVSLELINFKPISEAKVVDNVSSTWPEIMEDAPDEPSTAYSENITPGIFFAPFVHNIAEWGASNWSGASTSTLEQLFWYGFAFFWIMVASIGSYYAFASKAKEALFIKIFVTLAVMIFFALPGINIYGMYVPIYYAFFGFGILMVKKDFGW